MSALRSFKRRLSIVMPTADYRVKYFRQCLRHLNDEGFDGDLLVLDFGKSRLDQQDLWSARDRFTVRYFYYGPDVPYFERMQHGAAQVDTPFTLFYPDDDFMFFDVMERCVDLLENDSTYSVAQGKALRFVDEKRPIRFQPYQKLPLEDDSPFTRFLRFCKSYNHHIYVVQRRESFLRKMKLGERFSDDGMFWQYYDSAASVIEGKTKVFPSLGMVRRIHNLGLGLQQAESRDMKAFPYLLLADDFTDKFRFFRQQLLSLLTEAGVVLDERQTQQFEDACINLVRWGISMQRGDESDRKFVPQMIKTVPEEAAKLRRIIECMNSDVAPEGASS